jgi:hypothetical protein
MGSAVKDFKKADFAQVGTPFDCHQVRLGVKQRVCANRSIQGAY